MARIPRPKRHNQSQGAPISKVGNHRKRDIDMTKQIIPSGALSVRTTDSKALYADDLLGRPHIPAIAHAVTKVGAAFKGFLNDPMNPSGERDKLLATWERGLDIHVKGGASLRALDAASGKFHVHLTPNSLSDGYSLHVALAPAGDEKNAVVQDNPHAPAAPIGFYNLDRASQALHTVKRVLTASVKDSKTENVNRLRAQSILNRLEKTQSYLETLKADRAEHPVFATLKNAAEYAYNTKKLGDENDQKLKAALSEVKTYVAAHPELRAELKEQIKEEIGVIKADQKKWADWRSSTGIHTFYVNMG